MKENDEKRREDRGIKREREHSKRKIGMIGRERVREKIEEATGAGLSPSTQSRSSGSGVGSPSSKHNSCPLALRFLHLLSNLFPFDLMSM